MFANQKQKSKQKALYIPSIFKAVVIEELDYQIHQKANRRYRWI